MRRPAKALALMAAILPAACLAAGCGHSGTVGGAIASSTVTGKAAAAKPTVTAQLPTAKPATAAPAVQPSATAKPASPAPPPPSAPAATSGTGTAVAVAGSNSAWPWIWVAGGAVLLIAMIAWIVIAARRRSARGSVTAAHWRSQVIDAYAEGAALNDSISLAQGPGTSAGEDADARWAGLQDRADDLTRALYRLREAAPDDGARMRVADTLSSLQAVRSAITAERASGSQASAAETVRGRLSFFAASLQALRLSVERPA